MIIENFKDFDKSINRNNYKIELAFGFSRLPISYFNESGEMIYENQHFQIWFDLTDTKIVKVYFYNIEVEDFQDIDDLISKPALSLIISEKEFDKEIKSFKDIVYKYNDIINNKKFVERFIKTLKSKKFNL